MSSSGRSSAEWFFGRARRLWGERAACRLAAAVAFGFALAGTLPALAQTDVPPADPPEIGDDLAGEDVAVEDEAAPPSGSLAECRDTVGEGEALGPCLEAMAVRVADALAAVQGAANAYFAELDAISGNERASRTLSQGENAFALYRDLDCHLVELAQGVSTAASDHRVACQIDHDRGRIARLAALLPEAPPIAADEAGSVIFATSWRAIEVDGAPVAEGVEITLDIDEAGGVTGQGGCNRYFGAAEIEGETIAFGPLGATRMACPEPAMGEETRYLAAVEAARAWSIEGGTLSLSDDSGAVRVRLEPVAG